MECEDFFKMPHYLADGLVVGEALQVLSDLGVLCDPGVHKLDLKNVKINCESAQFHK